MIKVDLITGFLGSGKTTFLKKYAQYFIDKGYKVGILENDYGAVNVDMLLLNELRGEKCELEMVAGACDADCHKRRFKTKLISMGMSGYNRVIIEPSGIFDVDEFFDSLREEPLERWYEVGNVIAVVDSKLEDNLSAHSEFFLASQIANAGAVVLSRTQMVAKEEIDNTVSHIMEAAKKAGINRDFQKIIFEKSWDDMTDDDMEMLSGCEYRITDYVKMAADDSSGYSTVYFLDDANVKKNLRQKIQLLMSDKQYGDIFRVKGFYKDEEKWHQVNATKKEILITDITVGQEVMIVIGEHLNEDNIKRLMSASQ